jgi:hypothetical protein
MDRHRPRRPPWTTWRMQRKFKKKAPRDTADTNIVVVGRVLLLMCGWVLWGEKCCCMYGKPLPYIYIFSI